MTLIKKRFAAQAHSYAKHANIQHNMAHQLLMLSQPVLDLLPNRGSLNLLELGCGSGTLTRQLLKIDGVKNYWANDLYRQADVALQPLFQNSEINYQFLEGDALTILPPKPADIIASGAMLQWIKQPQKLLAHFHQYLNHNGLMLFSTFSDGNYQEIKALTGRSLTYYSVAELAQLFSRFGTIVAQNSYQESLFFESPRAILQHMRQTGVNALTKRPWQKQDLLSFTQGYEKLRTDKGYPLTYRPWLVVVRK